ncbi:hypothetical protein ACLOJK_023472 [Asimina triloba]
MTTTTRGFRSLYLATNPADEHPGRRAPASSTPSSPPSATSPLPPSRHLVISAHGASTSVHHPSSDPDPSQIQPAAATINEPINPPASVHHAHARSRPITSVRPSPAADPPSFRPASGLSTAGTLISFHLHRRSATSLQQTTLHHAQSTTILQPRSIHRPSKQRRAAACLHQQIRHRQRRTAPASSDPSAPRSI